MQRLWLPRTLQLPPSQERRAIDAYARVQASWSERAGTLAFARMFPRDPSSERWVMTSAAARLREREPRALILWGSHDRSFGPSALSEWRARLPNARVEELPAGPLVPEDAPELAAAAIAAFLREL
jgi:pimeloyl-ACP methyl ester carboxylesterase